MAFDAGTVKGQLSFDHSSFSKAAKSIKKDQTAIAKTTKTTGSAFKGMWKQVAAGVGVTALVTSGIRMIGDQLKDTIRKGREFEDAWSNVTTMISDTSINTADLRDELINLSPTLGSTTDLAKGMYQVLSASIEPAKAIEFLGEAAKAAKAGVTDVATSVDALTTVINAYGMEASAVTNVSDVMFQTVKRGKLNYEELATSLGTVVPIAANLGVNFTEIGATMATMTRQGIDASTATMQLRQVLMSILTPSEGAMKVAEGLGIELGANALKTKGLVGWLKELREKTGGSADAMGKLVPNARALTGVMALAGERVGEMLLDQKLMNEAWVVGGQTTEAFTKKMQDATFWMDAGKEATNKFKTAFYLGFVEPFKQGITNADDLDKVTKDLTATFSELGEALGTLAKMSIPILGKQLEIWTGHFNNIFLVAEAVIHKIKGTKTAVDDLGKAVTKATWKDFISDTLAASQAQFEVTGTIGVAANALIEEKAAAAAAAAALALLSQKTSGFGTRIDKLLIPGVVSLTAELGTLRAELEAGVITWDEWARRSAEAREKIAKLEAGLDDLDMALEDTEIFIDETGDSADVLAGVFENLGMTAPADIGKVTKAVKISATKIENIWANMAANLTSGMAAAFTSTINLGSIFYSKLEEFDSRFWDRATESARKAYEEQKALITESMEDDEENTQAAINRAQDKYEKRKAFIMENFKSEKRRDKALAKLEDIHQARLERIEAEALAAKEAHNNSLIELENQYQADLEAIKTDELAAREAHDKEIERQQNSLWGKLKTVFGDTLNDMLNMYLQDFIGGILSGAADAASGIIGSIGGAISGLFGGGGAGEGGGGIGGLIGGVGGASPWGAIAAGVGGLLGGLLAGGGDKHLLEGIKENTWETKMDLRNVVNNQDFLKSRADWTHGELTTVNAQLNSIKISNWDIGKSVGRMKNTLWRVETILKNITSAALGYKSTKTELVVVHGTPDNPEYIIPHEDLTDLEYPGQRDPDVPGLPGGEEESPDDPGLTEGEAGGGKAGGRKPKPTFDIKIKSIVNLIGTIITDREYTRETIIPEMTAAFEANIRKVDFLEALDIPD